MKIPKQSKYKQALNQLIMAGLLLTVAVIAWYMLLYHPVSAKIVEKKASMKSDQDSLAAAERYKVMDIAFQKQIKELNQKINEWDASFPSRSSIVSLAKQLTDFFDSYSIELLEMQPSLFELYALERAGNNVDGDYVSKQLLNMKLRGRYLNLGRMLEQIDTLPFKVTVTDLDLDVIPLERPELEINLDMFLYVHK